MTERPTLAGRPREMQSGRGWSTAGRRRTAAQPWARSQTCRLPRAPAWKIERSACDGPGDRDSTRKGPFPKEGQRKHQGWQRGLGRWRGGVFRGRRTRLGLQGGLHVDGLGRHPVNVLNTAMAAVGVDENLGEVIGTIDELFQG